MPSPKTQHSHLTCSGGDTGPNSAVELLLEAAAKITTTNAELTARLSRLTMELSELASIQMPTPSGLSMSGEEEVTTVGNGSGAASPEIYQEMLRKNWHGRLGRTHMADVDSMPDSAKKELDCFLRRKFGLLYPVGGAHTSPDPDALFAALAALGLRLEDRGAYADVVIFNDKVDTPTAGRLQNFSAWYYAGGGGDFDKYWKGSALETLLELGRYRGLFDDNGFLKLAS